MRVRRSAFAFTRPGGKHRTPKHIDHLFQREVIPEAEYKEFWPRFWKADNAREQKRVVADFSGASVVTKNKAEAEADAKRLSDELGERFTVRRRDKRGRFSKRGKHFQAIRST